LKYGVGDNLESWVLGATLTLIGFLVSICGLGASEWSFSFSIVGVVIIGVGAIICVTKFRQWLSTL